MGDDPSGIFIRGVSGSSSSDALETVFCQPVLPGNCVRSIDWNEMELSPRSLESWQATFASLKHAASEAGDEVDLTTVAKVMENTKAEFKFVAMTPNPKRAGKRGHEYMVEMLTSEDEEDLDVKPSAMETLQKKRSVAPWKDVPEDIGNQQATPSVKVLQGGAWGNLVANVNTLRLEHEKEGKERDLMEASLDDEIERLHVKLSVIHALLGERPAEFGTQSAFEILAHCMTTVHSLQDVVGKRLDKPINPEVLSRLEAVERKVEQAMTSSKLLVQEGLEKFFGDKSDFRQQFVNPTLSLLSRSSSHTGDPGGKWAALFSDMMTRISALEQSKQSAGMSPNFGGGGRCIWLGYFFVKPWWNYECSFCEFCGHRVDGFEGRFFFDARGVVSDEGGIERVTVGGKGSPRSSGD